LFTNVIKSGSDTLLGVGTLLSVLDANF
jgi:hypothetical protein